MGQGKHCLPQKRFDNHGIWQLMELQPNTRWIMDHCHGPACHESMLFNRDGPESGESMSGRCVSLEISGPVIKCTQAYAMPDGKICLTLRAALPLLQQLRLPGFVYSIHTPSLAN
jgi:hypothetical protein